MPDIQALIQAIQAAKARAGGGVSAGGATTTPVDNETTPNGESSPQGLEGIDPATALKKLIMTAKVYMEVEPEPEDKAVVARFLHELLKIQVKDQAAQDQAMQGTMTPRFSRKQAPGGFQA